MALENNADRYELVPGDALYPASLSAALGADAPKLYVLGNPEALGLPSVTVTGTRRATPYGLAVAEEAADAVAEYGHVMVTGGARGCEAAANRRALDRGGRIIIVPGTGADLVYPKDSADIFHRAIDDGRSAIVSMFPWGTGIFPNHFLVRRCLIAALSHTTVIAESGLNTGTIDLAEMARSYGRDVLAAPGSIYSENSEGANRLIATGKARIIVGYETIVQAITQERGEHRSEVAQTPVYGVKMLDDILAMLGEAPMQPGEITLALDNAPLADTLHALACLEMDGRVVRLPDGGYSAAPQCRVIGTAGTGFTIDAAKAVQKARPKAEGHDLVIRQ